MTGIARPLTSREREVAEAIHRGRSYAEIAIDLDISEHTVRAHVRTVSGLIIGLSELPPRWRVYVWMEREHAKTLPRSA